MIDRGIRITRWSRHVNNREEKKCPKEEGAGFLIRTRAENVERGKKEERRSSSGISGPGKGRQTKGLIAPTSVGEATTRKTEW